MTQPWTIRPPVTPSPELAHFVGGHPLVAQLLAQRGIDTVNKARSFLDPKLYAPAPPTNLLGLENAAQVLCKAIRDEQNILVWGDFDVDGQTSTALFVTALHRLMGEGRVRFHVPNRFEESHGIRVPKLKEKLAQSDIPIHLLLTCDTGIAEADGVTFAKDQELTVVITDHHDPPQEILDFGFWIADLGGHETIQSLKSKIQNPHPVLRADAIVNPKFQSPTDPLRTLPGVGVAFKLIQRLYELCGRAGEEQELLDLVALGIVADVAEQVNDARYLLQMGLEQLRRTRRAGLLALMDVSRVQPATLSAETIGFQLGPRMNALGRLEDATVSVELLSTRDAIRAGQLAAKLERLNQERRLLTSQTTKAALDMIERDPKLLDFNALVLAHPGWHAGIVGIVASRLVEEFGKPTVLMLNPPNENARGSARSIPGVDIGASIAACSHLLLTHGGHPGAAGVSLLPENVDKFRRELSRQVQLHRSPDAPTGLLIDAELPLEQLSLELVEQVNRLAPFGNGNPQPQFLSRNLMIADDRRLGKEGQHRKLTVKRTPPQPSPEKGGSGSDEPTPEKGVSVIWFDGADVEVPAGSIDLVYTLSINEYRGERSLQLGFVELRAAEVEEEEGDKETRRQGDKERVARAVRIVVHDYRQQENLVGSLPTGENVVWYAEGIKLEKSGIAFAPRTQLAPSTSSGQAPRPSQLILWSIPPSPSLLHWLIETVEPNEVYLCGQQTSDDSQEGVLKSVAAMCKYVLGRDQRLFLNRMAARLGTTESVIRYSLLWLEFRGMIRIEEWCSDDEVRIAVGVQERQDDTADLCKADLEKELAEVRAYRKYCLQAKPEALGIDA